MQRMRKLVDYVAYLAVRVCVCLVQASPIERCDRWSTLVGTFLHRWVGLRNGLVRENLERVFPQWDDRKIRETTHDMWRHLLLMFCEIAQAPRKIHRTNWYEYFTIGDRAVFLRVALDERPKIFVTGHFGNFELAGFINGLFGLPSTTLARTLDNRFIHDYLNNFRSRGGQHFLSKDHAANEVQKLLESGGTLGLLADQDAGVRGCWVRFLGHHASCHKALALFTLVNQAPMLVCYNRRLSRPLTFELGVCGLTDPAVPAEQLANVHALTQWYNDCLEQPIRKHPEQYWWLHRRWREPPARLRRESTKTAKDTSRKAG
jgi:KDO2-lipid IV(A) lauroyltransferase